MRRQPIAVLSIYARHGQVENFASEGTFNRRSAEARNGSSQVSWFTSSNDASMIGVLRFIGLIDGSSIPTPLWSEYRGQKHRAVLGKAIKQGYADLFALYPDANAASVADLTHVFSTSSTGGEQVIRQTVQTFKTLVEEADFSSAGGNALSTGPLHAPAAPSMAPALPGQNSGSSLPHPAVHIDIQIHISPDSSSEQIDKIFESMAKHLYGSKPVAQQS
nr:MULTISPECIES: DUF5343 domain-containing protein [unclassified Bradyrhizobium]